MAVPATFTTLDITGKFVMNKSLSDPMDDVLTLQGVSWFKRQAIKVGTVTLLIKHYKDEAGVEHIDISQLITGGFEGTKEERTLNWEEKHKEDHVFGAFIAKSRRIDNPAVDDTFLSQNWTEDTLEHGHIESNVVADPSKGGKKWSARQIWGIELINGERRYARHLRFIGPKGENMEKRMVYDYQGTL